MEDDFRLGADGCRWISVQTVAPLYPKVCNLTNHEKSEASVISFSTRRCKTYLNFAENF